MRRLIKCIIAASVAAAVCPSAAFADTGNLRDAEVPGYELGPGDKLRIVVFNEPTLSGDYALTSEGHVSFPLIGDIAATRMTLSSLQDTLTSRLSHFLKEPHVSVEQLNYRSYYVLGEVNKPGQYPFSTGLKVDQAVAAAGGFTYRANRGTAFVRRGDNSREDRLKLKAQRVFVMPGDTIRIGERFF